MSEYSLPKTYDFKATEQRIYELWEKGGYFKPWNDPNKPGFDPGVKPFVISIPPPNVTGELHLGHALFVSVEDLMIRYHRMKGVPSLWVPGTDHAGIATQLQVENHLLRTEEVTREELGREEFVRRTWDWKAKYGDVITNQIRRLGASCDWDRERFTLDDGLSKAVREAFVRLYEKGLIYRGPRMINWSPGLKTAVSDLEVEYSEEEATLYYFKYMLAPVDGGSPDPTDGEYIPVATVRPETILGDTAVAVHPDDERYKRFISRKAIVPIVGREIPVIADDYVSREFGTGALKITPGHDPNDYEIGHRHGLELISVLDRAAKINENGGPYQGLDRFEAREKLWADMKAAGLTIKTEKYITTLPRSQRGGEIVEPMVSEQWFVSIAPLAEQALRAVRDGEIHIVPEHFEKVYFNWLENIKDWCISRQLWWGHRIPVWYCADCGKMTVAREDPSHCAHCGSADIQQDPDVLDTWFSSGLWPFSTLGWPEATPELKTFYPTSVLVTGFDIIFFWVARMIMMGLKFMGDVPFKEVYIHGLIRDSDGQKMSKSKGNILDPLDLIDGISLDALMQKRTAGMMQPQLADKIEKATRKHFPEGIDSYGTDALRFTFAALASTGRDINFDIGRIQGYRNFCNKIWNAARYVLMNLDSCNIDINNGERTTGLVDRWIQTRLAATVERVNESISGYRFDLASQAIYEFTWDEYCDWYLEFSKVPLNDKDATEAQRRGTLYTLVRVMEILLRLMHPFMPFITEEIWSMVAPRLNIEASTIMLRQYPDPAELEADRESVAEIEWVKLFILGVRRIRGEHDIPPGKPFPVHAMGNSAQQKSWLYSNSEQIKALARIDSISETEVVVENSAVALAGDITLFAPLADLIDHEEESNRLMKEINKLGKEIARVSAKLNNQNFIERAPVDVVEKERNKLMVTETALEKLQAQHDRLKQSRSSKIKV